MYPRTGYNPDFSGAELPASGPEKLRMTNRCPHRGCPQPPVGSKCPCHNEQSAMSKAWRASRELCNAISVTLNYPVQLFAPRNTPSVRAVTLAP